MWKSCAGLGMMAVLLLAPAVYAQSQKEKEPPGTPAEQYEELVREFNEARQAFMKKYQNAKTQEERQKLFTKEYPRPEQFSGRFLELAQSHPGDPGATRALIWVVSNAGSHRDGRAASATLMELVKKDPELKSKMPALIAIVTSGAGPTVDEALRLLLDIGKEDKDDEAVFNALAAVASRGSGSTAEKAADFLLEHHIDNEALANVCFGMIYNRGPQADGLLRKVIEKSANETVQGAAHLALAKRMLRSRGDEPSEALELLEKIVTDFADVKYRGRSLSKMAEGDLFEIRHLQIGMVAPNIEGEDIDGQKFALNDYKGKVVVLDFWGNW